MINTIAMSKTIYFETLESLLAYATEAYEDYSGPYPEWAVGSERKCAAVYAKRAAFGLHGVDQLQLEDYTPNVALLDSMGEKLHAAAVAYAYAEAEQSVALQDGRKDDGYITLEMEIDFRKEGNNWPNDFPDEHWHFAATRELIYAALTQK